MHDDDEEKDVDGCGDEGLVGCDRDLVGCDNGEDFSGCFVSFLLFLLFGLSLFGVSSSSDDE